MASDHVQLTRRKVPSDDRRRMSSGKSLERTRWRHFGPALAIVIRSVDVTAQEVQRRESGTVAARAGRFGASQAADEIEPLGTIKNDTVPRARSPKRGRRPHLPVQTRV